MNYRVLFFISFLILIIGIGGLLFMPSGEQVVVQQTSDGKVQPVEEKPKKLITIAELKNDIGQGKLLQATDYVITEISVAEDSSLIANDLKEFLAASKNKNLQGYLMAENVKSGSFLLPTMLIAPDDPRFIISSLDPKQEVAYRIYVKAAERYILDTVIGGAIVSVYSQQESPIADNKMDLIKVANNLKVLQVMTFTNDEENTGSKNDDYSKEYVGYINLKVTPEHIMNFYSLDKRSKLIVLPDSSVDENMNHRGVYIRKLRGQ